LRSISAAPGGKVPSTELRLRLRLAALARFAQQSTVKRARCSVIGLLGEHLAQHRERARDVALGLSI
jgi:hypothetical protein